MLETVREFVAERLAARPDANQVRRRHAGYYRALAEHADRPLRSTAQGEWLERLDAEAGNLAAAVRWYLAHDPGPLPHLFRVLWPFWFMLDHAREGRSWMKQLLPAVGTLDPQARAELAWAAAVIDVAVGDDAAALVDRQRLAPLLAGIGDPHCTVLAWRLTCRVRPDKHPVPRPRSLWRPASRLRHRAQRPNSVELCFSTQFRLVPPVAKYVNSSTRAPRTLPRSDLAPRPAMICKAPPSGMSRQEVSWRRDVGDPAAAVGPRERSLVPTRPCSVAGHAPQRIWHYITRCDADRHRRCS